MSLNSYQGEGAIICGSAPCVKEDFEIVRSKRKNHIVIGINEAIWAIKCDMLMTYHFAEIDYFLSKSLNKELEIHTSDTYPGHTNKKITGRWSVKGGATSAIDAVQICQQMGFDEIILVGCPMMGGDGYFHSQNAKETEEGCPRFGNKENIELIQKHKSKLKDLAGDLNFDTVYSVSGFTAEIFGKPNL